MPHPQTQVIIGADGGIGAAYVSACLAAASDEIDQRLILTSRREVCGLRDNQGSPAQIDWLTLDYESTGSALQLAQSLSARTSHIDSLVIASGLLHDNSLSPEKNINALSALTMQRLFCVNAAGPMSVLSALQPLLKKASQPKVAVLSAQVGSIEDNHLGGWYSYRMSKAALNMGLKTAAIELARWKNSPAIVAVHPGTTHSPLSQPFVKRRKAPVQSARRAGQRLHELVSRLTPEHSGQFVTLDGDTLPW